MFRETCVVSDDQTEIGLGKSKLEAMRALLDGDSPRLWIYVGASMRDRDLLRVFGDEDWARGVDERWVSPFLTDTVEEFATLRIPFWRQRGLQSIDDRLISETADSFFFALSQALKSGESQATYRPGHGIGLARHRFSYSPPGGRP